MSASRRTEEGWGIGQCSCFPVSAWESRSGLSVGGGTGIAEPLEAMVAAVVDSMSRGKGRGRRCVFVDAGKVCFSLGSCPGCVQDLWLGVVELAAAYVVPRTRLVKDDGV